MHRNAPFVIMLCITFPIGLIQIVHRNQNDFIQLHLFNLLKLFLAYLGFFSLLISSFFSNLEYIRILYIHVKLSHIKYVIPKFLSNYRSNIEKKKIIATYSLNW